MEHTNARAPAYYPVKTLLQRPDGGVRSMKFEYFGSDDFHRQFIPSLYSTQNVLHAYMPKHYIIPTSSDCYNFSSVT